MRVERGTHSTSEGAVGVTGEIRRSAALGFGHATDSDERQKEHVLAFFAEKALLEFTLAALGELKSEFRIARQGALGAHQLIHLALKGVFLGAARLFSDALGSSELLFRWARIFLNDGRSRGGRRCRASTGASGGRCFSGLSGDRAP